MTASGKGHVILEIMQNNWWKKFNIESISDFKIARDFIINHNTNNFIFELQHFDERFYEDVFKSRNDTVDQRRKRLEIADPKAKKVYRKVAIFLRNVDVVAEVLERANGQCGLCKKEAPFVRVKDDTPYLEVHHKVRLADGGSDTVDNAIALCPNCHRREHYGKQTLTEGITYKEEGEA